MSLSKKEFYSDFLYGFNGSNIKWVLYLKDNSNTEELVKEDNTKEKKSPEKEGQKENGSKKLELEVLFSYNKKTEVIRLSGNQITSVLGYPSSSLIFNSKDIKDITKTNSTYKFSVKNSPYYWEMTLSSRGVENKEEFENEDTGNIKKNKFIKSN